MPSNLKPSYSEGYLTCTRSFYPPSGGAAELSLAHGNEKWYDAFGCTNTEVKGDHRSPNPFHFDHVLFSGTNGVVIYADAYFGWEKYEGSGVPLPYDFPSHGLDDRSSSTMISQVYTKALAKVIKDIKNSDVNIGATIGEGRQTLQILSDIKNHATQSAGKLSKLLRRTKFDRKLKAVLNVSGGSVLLANLGISPLLGDVKALGEHVLLGRAENVTFRYKSRASDSANETFKLADKALLNNVVKTTVKYTGSCRVELGGNYTISDLHSFENWRAGVGFRASTAWELITLSWLVDYFVRVGEFLELTEAALMNNGFTVSGCYKTVSRLDRLESSRIASASAGPTSRYLYSAKIYKTKNVKLLSRTVGDSLAPPSQPVYKIPRASSQLLNCAALLSQLLK